MLGKKVLKHGRVYTPEASGELRKRCASFYPAKLDRHKSLISELASAGRGQTLQQNGREDCRYDKVVELLLDKWLRAWIFNVT